jgi:hypothetical protein
MSGSRTPDVQEIRNAEPERWLAIQTAYQKYTNASTTLDLLTSQVPNEASCPDVWRLIERAASEQRSAFESYVEARMQYCQFQFDRNKAGNGDSQCSHTAGALPNKLKSARPSRAAFTDSRPALQAAVLVLVCGATFSLVDLVRERRLHGSDPAWNEVRAMLSQTCDGLQVLIRKVDALSDAQRFALQKSAGAIVAPGSRHRRTAAKSKGTTSARSARRLNPTPYRALQKQGKTLANRKDLALQVKTGEPTYYAFTLPISQHFERVGPLRLSLRKVNVSKKCFDLCIMADNFRFRQVRLFEPVRINLSDPSRRVDLVVNRIDKKYVNGYLTVRKTERSELASGQVRPRRAGGS